MTAFVLTNVRRVMRSPIGIRLLDDFAGGPPIAPVHFSLSVSDGTGGWRAVDQAATVTPSGRATFVGLGRTSDPTSKPTRQHRARLASDAYLPLYGPYPALDGLLFDVPPYDDERPPAPPPQRADVFLLPSFGYPFPAGTPILYGLVVDSAGDPVAGALVQQSHLERALTDARGAFALPLRWVAPASTVQIDAADAGGRIGTQSIQFPDDLRHSCVIAVS